MIKRTLLATVAMTWISLSARADTLGVGTFSSDIDLTSLTTFPEPMSGTISFNDENRTFFGTPVNMGTQVGTLQQDSTLSGLTSIDPTTPQSGGFVTVARAISDPNLFTLSLTGHYVCAASGCETSDPDSFIANTATLSGTFYTSTLQPIGAVYTAEGGSICCIGSQCVPPVAPTDLHCTGTFAINGFQSSNTPASNSPPPLSLSGTFFNTLSNTLQTTSVDVTFKKVAAGGTTTLTATSNQAGTIPPNFKIDLPGFQPIYFDVSTTATFQSRVQVCLHYQDDGNGHLAGTTIPESQLALIHQVNGTWDANTASSVDTVNNVVCAMVSSLSPFGFAVRNLGVIPPTAASLKCEDGVTKNVVKLAGGILKCQVRAASAAFKQAAIDEGACEASARAIYDEKNAKLSGCPQCLLDAEAAVADGITSAADAVPAQAYCDGTMPIP
jgi:hypothetical protein